MNIPVIKICSFGRSGDLGIEIRDQIADDLLNYIRHKISNTFTGSIFNKNTIDAIQTFVNGELLQLVSIGQIDKDYRGIWIIKDYRLWV